MLRKLFEHEWKAFYKLPALVNITLAGITLLGLLSLLSPIWKTDNPFVIALIMFSFMFYIFALIIGPLIVTALTAVRFYKHVYTDEGYLTHTLPVTPRQIILSKIFVSCIWMFITIAVLILSVAVLLFAVVAVTSNEYQYEVNYGFRFFFDAFMQEFNIDFVVFIVYFIVSLLIGTLFSILTLYAAISLGQLFTSHKVLASVICYIGLMTGIQIVTSVVSNVQLFITTRRTNTLGYYLNSSMIITLVLTALGCVGFYFITEYVMKRKLNLD